MGFIMGFLFLLPIAGSILLWLFMLSLHADDNETSFVWQDTLIKAILYWFVIFAVGTELLSLIKGLTILGVALLWSVVVVVLLAVTLKRKSLSAGWRKARQLIHLPKKLFEILALICIVAIILILLITGILSPPNIHDVLTYHMTRVMHWIQDRSVAYYPTSITFQLWHPPFAEYNLLHWTLLSGNTYLSAFHQWYGLVLTLIAIAATAGRLGAKSRGQWVAALFYVTLPIVVLQASGSKNDVFLGYLIATLAYFVVKAARTELDLSDWFGAAISVGLGLLTKGSYAFYALPLLAWLLVVVIKKSGVKRAILVALLGLLVVSGLNAGYWVRNIRTFGSPLATEDSEYLRNGRYGLDVFVSNLSKNIVLQVVSLRYVDNYALVGLEKLHNYLQMEMFEQTITLGPPTFYDVPTREEVASNPLQFLTTGLVFLVLLIMLIFKKDKTGLMSALILGISAMIGVMAFSAIFRWQVWGSRYFVPYFVLFAPVVGYLFGERSWDWMGWLLCAGFVIWSINPLINNYSRSFSWSESNRNSVWTMSRKGLLFANHQTYEGAILELTYEMYISDCREYGMITGKNVPEYLIWATLTPDASEYHLEHYDVDNVTASLESPDFDPCGIIVFEVNPPANILDGSYILGGEWAMESSDDSSLWLYFKPEYMP